MSVQSDGSLDADRTEPKYFEALFMIHIGPNRVGFKSRLTNKWLSAQPDGSIEVNRDEIGDWETFKVTHHSDSVISVFCPYWGKYLCAENDYSVKFSRTEAHKWEKFELTPPERQAVERVKADNHVPSYDDLDVMYREV